MSLLCSTVERLEPRTLFAAPTVWTSRGVGGGGALFSPSYSPFNASEMYVQTDMSEPFRTTNAGASWTLMDFRQLQGDRTLKVNYTSNANVLYALKKAENPDGTTTERPARSGDGGATWATLSGWTGGTPYFLSADPNSATRLLASDSTRLYFSADSGATWSLKYTRTAGLYVAGAFWDPNGTNVYVGTNAGLLTSGNGGSTFALSSVTGIAAGQAIHSFAGAKSGGVTRLYAVTWNSADVYAGMFDEMTPDSYRGVYSLDVGQAAWTSRSGGVPTGEKPFYVVASPGNTSVVYLGGANRTAGSPMILKSTAGGSGWADVLNTANNANVKTGWQGSGGDSGWGFGEMTLGLAVSPTNVNQVDFGYVHTTSDGGATWTQAYVNPADANPAGSATPKYKAYRGIGLEDTAAHFITWSDADTMNVGYTDITATRSDDGGASFSFGNYNGLRQNTIYHYSKAANGTLYASSSSVHDMYQSTYVTDAKIDGGTGRVLMSTNAGASWTNVHDFAGPTMATAIDPHNANRMFAAVAGSVNGGIYVTTNLSAGSGSTWVKLPAPPRTQGHAYKLKILADGTLVATYSARYATSGTVGFTASSGVFVSTDGGNTWADRSAAGMQYWTKDLMVDPTDPTQRRWYASVRSGYGGKGNGLGGLYRSTDRGVTWTRVFSAASCESATIDPLTGELYLCTLGGGLYYSANASAASPTFGQTNYPFKQPEQVFVNPYVPGEIWVASFGWGVSVGNAQSVIRGNVYDMPDTPGLNGPVTPTGSAGATKSTNVVPTPVRPTPVVRPTVAVLGGVRRVLSVVDLLRDDRGGLWH